MKSTDVFNMSMISFFGCEEGAYTSFTETEIGKGTYNVKKSTRNLMIKRMGRANIPVVNVTSKQDIRFKICPKSKIYKTKYLDIPCKFSKKDKDEMTIYFNQELIRKFNAKAGDVWYVYFIADSKTPVIGLLSKDKWENLFGNAVDLNDEKDITQNDDLEYKVSAESIEIIEEKAPEKQAVIKLGGGKTIVKSLTADEAAKREKNRKKKGNRGEEIAVEIEKRRLLKLGRPDLVDKIVNVAKYKDGLGYDLISTDIDKSGKEIEIYIEVKSSSLGKDTPFYVSPNEVETSRRLSDYYFIYRIYEMKADADKVKYYKLNGSIDVNYNLIPTEYLAFRK